MQKQKNMKLGAAGFFFFFSLLFFVLICRFLYIEVTGTAGGEVLASKIDKKYEKQQVLEAKRGSILDRKGEVIAEDTSSYILRAVLSKKEPNHVNDPEMTAKKLANFIDMDENEIYERLSKKGAFQVEFGRAGKDLTQDTKQKIEQLELPGITFGRTNKRFYPNGIFASHLIGYVEKDEDTGEMNGKLGIEKYLNKELKETDGSLTYDSDFWGLMLPDTEEKVNVPDNGSNVSLTIDKKIQTFLEDSMSKVQKKYNPEQIIAIVADPKTGEILALGQRPTFHPSTKEGLTDTWQNLSIEETYEPGSTMKTFTLAAAVEEGKFNPNETFKAGTYKVGVSAIHDHSGIEDGKIMTYLEGVQRSSNVAFAKLAMEKLGPETFQEYLTKFGFDKKTGIDLPNEVIGKIQYKYKMEKVTTAFGQGSTITAMQQIQAASAIANDGKMMQPYVIKSISDQDSGKVLKTTKPKVSGQPISAKTAEQVREYLGTVITAKKGTGKKYAIDGYEVAGKTGTAQIPGPTGRYLEGKNNYLFSFLGMAPKDNPQLVMYVAVKQPNLGATYVGADPLSEIFNPVMQNSLQYLNIKPSNIKKQEAVKIKDYTDQTVASSANELKELGYEVVTVGTGRKVIDQSPKSDSTLLQGEKIILRTEGQIKVPDLEDWSLRDVMKLANVAKLDLKYTGTGYVSGQSIKNGKKVKAGDTLKVELTQPKEPEVSQTEKESLE